MLYFLLLYRTSVWEKPADLVDRADVEKMVTTPPAEVVGLKNKAEEPSKDEPLSKKPRTETPMTTAASASTILSVRTWLCLVIYLLLV